MMKSKKYNIGVQYLDAYPELRNILNILDTYKYIKIDDRFSKIRKIKLELRKYTKLKKNFKFLLTQKNSERYLFKSPKNIGELDFFHFFNTIYLKAEKPWGVTFETILPAFEPYTDFHKKDYKGGNKKVLKGIKKYLQALSNDKCKFIIAISACTYNIQHKLLDNFPEFKNKILPKIKILNPPQKLLTDKVNLVKKNSRDKIYFMFLGSDFTRKGGVEVLNVFYDIQNKYTNFHLDIIGKIDPKDFYSSNMTKDDIISLEKKLRSNHKRISYYPKLPNSTILDKMINNVDVGLLPTRSDTYGYSVLEFQASGCPVISTDNRALLEINNNDCGWIINVKQNEFKETFHFHKNDLDNIQTEIENQLKQIVIKILENPEEIYKKSLNALERIKREHSPKKYREELELCYKKALENE